MPSFPDPARQSAAGIQPGNFSHPHQVQKYYLSHQTRVIESYTEKDICQSRAYTPVFIVHPIRKHFPLPDTRFKRF